MSPNYWTVPREWPGQTVFIVGGGPSVLGQNLEALRGRRVIVINSSVYAVPWADILYFGDFRWWNDNRAVVTSFAGRVVTVSRMVSADKKVLVCRKTNPPGLAREHNSLMQKWTSFTAATNLAAHLIGPGGTIVWLGADGRKAADGRCHHHKPHRWISRPDCYDKHRADLLTIVPSLRTLKIAAFNASPGTAWGDILPAISLDDVLNERCVA
jgi:hypothetical protein